MDGTNGTSGTNGTNRRRIFSPISPIRPRFHSKVRSISIPSVANVALVYTYYEIGRMIVEDEQGGMERANYGKALLQELSAKLTSRFGKGWSVETLTKCRYFYSLNQ
ncbi:MAG: hypothetical protein IJS15_11215 [Victivallales bacterium]|nr:hypothetical protein [Victivallales bacterium]